MPNLSHHTLELPASDLADHPLLAHIPVWAPETPEFQALADNLAEIGQLDDVLVDSRHRVVDGRNRRNALRTLGAPVRCRVVASEDVASIIVAEIAQRRHCTKGALAFLVSPLLKPAVGEARKRRIANLPRSSTESTIDNAPKTAEDLARSLGFSRDLLFQALDIHRRFEKHPELREQFEPKILSGELGLGAAIQAIAGKLSTEGQAKTTGRPLELIQQAFTSVSHRIRASWEKLDTNTRANVTADAIKSVREWPEDVRAALKKDLRA